MSHSIRDEQRYYSIFQPTAFTQGIMPYTPYTRVPAYGGAWTSLTWGSNSGSVEDNTDAVRSDFYAGDTYASAQALIGQITKWGGQPPSTTPTNKGEAQYKAAAIIFMIGMLQGISETNKDLIGKEGETLFDMSWYGPDGSKESAESPSVVEATVAECYVYVARAAGMAKAGGANGDDVDSMVAYYTSIKNTSTAADVSRRQGYEEQKQLSTQAKEVIGEQVEDLGDQLDEMSKWACFGQRLIGIRSDVCGEETTGSKAARYAIYTVGGLLVTSYILNAFAPYYEAFQKSRD